jgi:pyruvate dehydrogenase E2 component (dihydrolipoamide acetyltransferase)
MVEDESSVEAFKDFTLADAGGSKPPPAAAEQEEKAPEPEKTVESKPEKKETKESAPAAKKDDSSTQDFGGPILASPIARRIALERGVPLRQIKGTGPGGRIIKIDVEKFTPAASAAAPAPSTGAAGAVPGAGYTDIPLTGMRRTIAKRLSESMFTAPHYYLTSSINMSKTLKLRKALNDAAAKDREGKPVYRLSVNDFIVKAVGLALLRVPECNSQWLEKEGVLRIYSFVDVSVAVATDVGLITPIVRGVQGKGVRAISDEIKVLGKKARDGKSDPPFLKNFFGAIADCRLKPEEYTGGTFTISNLGMFESVEHFTAIVPPPNGG